MIKNGGKGRDWSWVMGNEIETSSVMGNDEIETRSRERRDRSWVTTIGQRDQSWVTMALMRSVLGGSVFGGDAI